MARIALSLEGVDQLKKLQAFLNPKLYDKAIKGGISYASKAVPPTVAKGITASYALPSARIKKDIAKPQITDGGQTALLRFSRRPPTLTQYGARPGTRGGPQPGMGRGMGWGPPSKPGRPLTATVLRSQGRKPYANAFMTTGNSGNKVVLRRDSQGNLYGVYGPSIGSIFLGKSAIAQQLQTEVGKRVGEQFKKGFERVLGAASRGFG